MIEPVKTRTKIYKGTCPICDKANILANVDYEPATERLDYSYECLGCGRQEGLNLAQEEKPTFVKDIRDWLDRVHFTEKTSPKVKIRLWQADQMDDESKFLR